MRYTTEELHPGKLDKQPQWVQRRIKDLEGQIERLEAKLVAGPEDSEAWADPHSSAPRPLGKRPVVQFGARDDDGVHYTVYYRNGQLTINGTGETIEEEFVVMPRAANEVVIGLATPISRDNTANRKG